MRFRLTTYVKVEDNGFEPMTFWLPDDSREPAFRRFTRGVQHATPSTLFANHCTPFRCLSGSSGSGGCGIIRKPEFSVLRWLGSDAADLQLPARESSEELSMHFALGRLTAIGALSLVVAVNNTVAATIEYISPPGQPFLPQSLSPDGSSAHLILNDGSFDDFFWSDEQGLAAITIPSDPRYSSIGVADISADGNSFIGRARSGSAFVALRWTAGGEISELAGLREGNTDSVFPRAISADGTVIVGNCGFTNNDFEAVTWSNGNGSLTRLGHLGISPIYREISGPRAVSSDGSVIVGYSSRSDGTTRAFRWSANDGMSEMPSSTLTTHYSDAIGVSANGRYAVGYGTSLQHGSQAVIWDLSAETALGIGMLPASAFSVPPHLTAVPEGAHASAVSDDGQMAIGVSGAYARINSFGDSISYSRTFIWTPSSGIRTPMEFLFDDLRLDLGGAIVSEVYDLSADGKTLLASGLNADGVMVAMLVHLSVPEPASSTFIGIGLLALAAFGRRKQPRRLPAVGA